jgi:hypothetical protein
VSARYPLARADLRFVGLRAAAVGHGAGHPAPRAHHTAAAPTKFINPCGIPGGSNRCGIRTRHCLPKRARRRGWIEGAF